MLYSKEHKVCVYETSIPERITACVLDAKILNKNTVAVPCNLRNMQTLRALGYEAVSPILDGYEWPGRFKPFDHQRHMAAFLTLHPRSFNLSDIGTGKTLGTLWAADYLMRQGIIRKALVLSPLSTIYRVWQNEIFTHFLSSRSCAVLHGSRDARLERLSNHADFYIINHDGLGIGSVRAPRGLCLGGLGEAIQKNKDIDLIIVDEGSVYKDGSALRSKVLRQVIGDKPYIWWLTGTPTPNEPVDAHNQARTVRADYSESLKTFRERTMTRITTFKWVPRHDASKVTAQILQPAIIFKREECIDLPPCMTEDRDVELTPVQKAAYAKLKKEAALMLDSGVINAVNEAVLRLKLIQVSLGAIYDADHEVHKIDCAPRLAVLKEVIEQTKEKIIIFAPLTSVVNLIYTTLENDYPTAMVTGNVSAKSRNEIFRAFQQEVEPRIIVADPGTMAHGLTLTAAATVVWYGPTDKPEIYQQANGRINRPGQKNNMFIIRLSATPIEREIFKRLDGKQTMQGLILDLVKSGETE